MPKPWFGKGWPAQTAPCPTSSVFPALPRSPAPSASHLLKSSSLLCSMHIHHGWYLLTDVSPPSNGGTRCEKPVSRHPLVTQLLAVLTYACVTPGLRGAMVNGAAELLPSRQTWCSEVPHLLFDNQWMFSIYLITIRQLVLSTFSCLSSLLNPGPFSFTGKRSLWLSCRIPDLAVTPFLQTPCWFFSLQSSAKINSFKKNQRDQSYELVTTSY